MVSVFIGLLKINLFQKMKLNKNAFNDYIYENISNYENRYEVYYGGGGSGKSYGALSKIILKSCRDVRKVLIVRKVKATLLQSVYSLTKEILESLLPEAGMSFKENKTELEITLSNGSTFIFKGLDDSEKLKSINGVTDIVIEEATEISFSDFTQLDIRLRPKEENPQIYVLFNPVSKANWCYKHFFEKKITNAFVSHSSYKDNKFLTNEYRNMLENLIKTNKSYYKIYCLGEFATLDKLVFNDYEVCKIGSLTNAKDFVGLDFGYVNDPTAIIYGKYDGENVYILKEYIGKSMLNTDIYKKIIELNLNRYLIVADSAEKKSIDELKRKGLNIKASKKGSFSVRDDINFLLSKNIIIDISCKETITEFENYTWKKDNKTGYYQNIPIDKFNHLIDALRYGLQSVSDIKSQKSSLKIIKEY